MHHHATGATAGRGGPAAHPDDWAQTPATERDWKKLFLVVGLGILSWVATYVGMLELIEANVGDLPLVHKLIVGFSVAMLMVMIIWLLDQMFAPLPFLTRLLYVGGYAFLTIISVGFGFGFYWKVLESRSEASRAAEGAVGQVQSALFAASTRLDQLNQTLESLTAISRQKAENERSTGTSCPGSKAGDGPRRKMREDDAARFQFASSFVKGRAAQVKTDIGGLDADLARIAKDDKSIVDARTGTRNDFMRSLGRKLDNTVTGFNAFRTDPQLKQIRVDLAERADRTVFPDTRGGTYACPDPQLSAALKGVVRAIDGLPEVEKPRIATVEGAEATIEAFRRLTATFFGMLTLKLPPSADEQRELQKKAIQSVENPQLAARLAAASDAQAGLSKRDYVPLAIAIFVDLCLLLVSIGRPVNRLQGLVPKMREAERGPVIQILSRFNEIHRDGKMRESFEVLRHVVFDYAGTYYIAVPLDAPYTETRREQVIDPRTGKGRLVTRQIGIQPARREDLRVEAHLLANLFSSFEKDGVFKRVMWLNLEAARKRLHRQGSKFANAEAFRIYRFNDGAWSEIILGAVMGAARRVETARAQDPDYVAARPEPSLDTLAHRMRQAEEEAVREREPPRPKPVPERRQQPMFAAANAAGPSFVEPSFAAPGRGEPVSAGRMADPELEAKFGPYARRAREDALDPAAPPEAPLPLRAYANPNPRANARVEEPGHAFGLDGTDEAIQKPTQEPGKEPGQEPDNVLPFPHPSRAADDAGEIRMPSFMSRGPAAVAARMAPEARIDPQDITVTATERKFSFSLPMNDPRLGLSGVAEAMRRSASAAPQQAAAPEVGMSHGADAIAADPAALPIAATGPSTTTTPAATMAARTSSVTLPTGSERSGVLALPAPTLEHEHRG